MARVLQPDELTFGTSLLLDLYGGIMLDSFFGDDLARVMPRISLLGAPISPVIWYILFFALTTGVYTIYGGLKSAAWTDFLQIIILLFAGFLVPVLALAALAFSFYFINVIQMRKMQFKA